MEFENTPEELTTFVGIDIPIPLNLRLFRGNKTTAKRKEYTDEMTIIHNIDKITERETFEKTDGNWNKVSRVSVLAYDTVRMANLSVIAAKNVTVAAEGFCLFT